VILPAAGGGRRFGTESNKLFATLDGRPLWTHCVDRLARFEHVKRILIAVSPEDLGTFQRQCSGLESPHLIDFTTGGKERSDTVAAAIGCIGASDDEGASHLVAIHDAARPLVTRRDLESVFAKAAQTGAAILAQPVTGTLKRERSPNAIAPNPGSGNPGSGNPGSGTPGARNPGARNPGARNPGAQTVDREGMWVAQTPQVFRLDWIRQAYSRHRGRAATDDAQLIERLGFPVAIVSGSADNIKITYPEDLLVAEALLAASKHAASLETENGEHDASETDTKPA
jgi:2-C-methyl-D-erythritol 4-phosphate cytidylyltransferase